MTVGRLIECLQAALPEVGPDAPVQIAVGYFLPYVVVGCAMAVRIVDEEKPDGSGCVKAIAILGEEV